MNHILTGISTIFACTIASTLGWTWYYLNHCITHPDLDEENEFEEYEKPPRHWRTTLNWRLHEHRVLGLPHLTFFKGNERNYKRIALKSSKEKIATAALRHPDGFIYSVSNPGRHGDVIRYMDSLGKAGIDVTRDQGFITTHGRYVNRREGLEIARQANQIIQKTMPTYLLFSEDIW